MRLKPFHYIQTSAKRTIRYGLWEKEAGKNRGTILLLPGRSEFLEKYGETVSDLTKRGFSVLSPDWYGQGLSTRPLEDRRKGYISDYSIYLEDMAWIVERVLPRRCPGPYLLLGHSMGGHIGLRYLSEFPHPFSKAVFSAPMIHIRTDPFSRKTAVFLAKAAVSMGLSTVCIPNPLAYDPVKAPFAENRLTSDKRRFYREKAMLAKNPDLALGGATFGWLSATLDSIRLLMETGRLLKIRIPVLVVTAKEDKIVDNDAQSRACAMMPNCTQIVLPHARHEILMEADSVRHAFFSAFDSFIGLQETVS